MNLIYSIWERISLIGIQANIEDLEDIEASRIKILNQFSFIWIFGLSLIYIKIVFVDKVEHVYVTKDLLIFMILILTLNYFRQYLLARFFALVGVPLLIFYSITLFGSVAGMEFGFVILIISSLLFVPHYLHRISFVIYNLILYIFSQYYIVDNPPPFSCCIDIRIRIFIFIISGLTFVAFINFTKKEYDKSLKRKNDFSNTLKKQNVALLSAYEELEQFSYIASHDLKTPLRTIVSFINLIEKNNQVTSTEDVEYFNFIKSGALRMNVLIEDLIKYSILSKENILQKEWVDCRLIIDEIIQQLRVNSTKEIETTIEDIPLVYSNSIYVSLLVTNLLSNAVKYNDKSKIELNISYSTTADGFIILTFKDNGIGIEKEFYRQIFEMFKRLHTDTVYEGTGIGLAICKRVVNKLNGEIWLSSQINEGTTFFVKIPFIQPKPSVVE